MKNIAFLLVLLMMLASLIFVLNYAYCEKSDKEKESGFHFRNTRFGMTMADVKKSEKDKPVLEIEDTLLYDDKLLNLKVVVAYKFVNKQLFRGLYSVSEQYRSKNNHINDYRKLKEALIKKYGKPLTDKEHWIDPLYKNKFHRHGFAVSIGHLRYFTEWIKYIEGRKVRIWLTLKGENYKISHSLFYDDVLLEKFFQEQQKEKEASKL